MVGSPPPPRPGARNYRTGLFWKVTCGATVALCRGWWMTDLALLGSLPVAIFYSFFVEHYVSSMTGAVKE